MSSDIRGPAEAGDGIVDDVLAEVTARLKGVAGAFAGGVEACAGAEGDGVGGVEDVGHRDGGR